MKKFRIQWLIVFVLSVVGCTQPKDENTTVENSDQNVLFIIVDDLKPTLGSYGDTLAITPNVDRLADMGIQFRNAHCNFAVCGPSRGSFLSGLRPETLGILDNVTPLQSVLGDRVTLPHFFKQNGFETVGIGKTFHDKEPDHEDTKAWDAYFKFTTSELGEKGEKRNLTNGEFPWCYWQAAEGEDIDQQDGQVTQKAVDLISTQRDKPFFLAVGLHKPHDPFVAPKKYFDMYPLENCTPPSLPEDWERAYPYSLPGWSEVFDKMTEQDQREFIRSYYACTSFMDAQVGRMLDALEETGQLDNTLIVLIGDHGYHLGEHGWWNKVTVYEEGTNAPMIIAGNAVKNKGVETEALVEFIDIYPTLIDVMGIEGAPEHLQGESFATVLATPTADFKEAVYAVTKRGDMLGRMVKTKQWRYIEWDGGEQGKELYHQTEDPQEYQNLALDPNYQAQIEKLSSLLRNKEI
ncbi:sulfatase [Reichenbachiella ulvae]|uniref:Sulfatase n=1 Tax=Reichenbachiella ulvae TaxID=2980104 RepID=A0ABT3CNT8_9BACT|nr:sulfatase [Reichenbachiella ulvae]MCV9385277.1 sulfatase [Reichenbachiella ulvae]